MKPAEMHNPESQQILGELQMLSMRSHELAKHLPRWHVSRLSQRTPLVLREHERDSLKVDVKHMPALQSGERTLRLCVPELSQTFANPSQAPQGPNVVLAQAAPSVFRSQERDSLLSTMLQRLLSQTGVMTRRL
ncbi:MAG: hypothetical protein ACI9KE_002821 [Polyangiales bacterium]|jgi:hypothetical protein